MGKFLLIFAVLVTPQFIIANQPAIVDVAQQYKLLRTSKLNNDCIKITRRALEDTHYTVQKCDTNDTKCLVDVAQKILNKIDEAGHYSGCSDSINTSVVSSLRRGLKAEADAVQAMNLFAKTEIVDTEIDFVMTYKEVARIAKGYDRLSFYNEQTQEMLEKAHVAARKCIDGGATTNVDTCYLSIALTIRAHFEEQAPAFEMNRAPSAYLTVFLKSIDDVRHLDTTLIAGVRKFASGDIIDAVVDLVATYKRVMEAVNDGTSCRMSLMKRLQKFLEDTHVSAERCNDLKENADSCFVHLLNDIYNHFIRLGIDAYKESCDNVKFGMILSNMKEVLKLPQKTLIDGIKYFALNRIISEDLELIRTYARNSLALRNAHSICGRSNLLRVQVLLDDIHKEGGRCKENVARINDTRCYVSLLTQLKSTINTISMEEAQTSTNVCKDPTYTAIMNPLKEALKRSDRHLMDPLKSFIDAQIITYSFDLVKVYADLTVAMQSKNEGCTTRRSKFQATLERVHDAIPKCMASPLKLSDDDCYNQSLDDIRIQLNELNRDLPHMNCADAFLRQLVYDLLEALKLPQKMLNESLNLFVNTQIINSTFDMTDIETKLNNAYTQASLRNCHAVSIKKTWDMFTESRPAAVKCYNNGKSGTNYECFKQILDRIRKRITIDESAEAQYSCTNEYYGDIRANLLTSMKLPEPMLIEALSIYGGAPAKSLSPLANDVDKCFSDEVDQLLKTRGDYRDQIEKCEQLAGGDKKTECSSNVFMAIKKYFLSDERMACFKLFIAPAVLPTMIPAVPSPTAVAAVQPGVPAVVPTVPAEVPVSVPAKPEATTDIDEEGDEPVDPTQPKIDYVSIYKSMKTNLAASKCASNAMKKAIAKFEEVNSTSLTCRQPGMRKSNKANCIRKAVNDIKTFMDATADQLKKDGCSDPAFTPALNAIERLYRRGYTFNAMKSYSFYTLADLRNEKA